jgi:hypothetical protein
MQELKQELRKVTQIFMSGKLSATVVIPIDIARRQGMDKPTDVIVQETSNGVLIRKIDLEKL